MQKLKRTDFLDENCMRTKIKTTTFNFQLLSINQKKKISIAKNKFFLKKNPKAVKPLSKNEAGK